MINVGITGTFSAITRHTHVLNKMSDIRITGRWITSGVKDAAIDLESGIACADPELIIGKADVIIITDNGSYSNHLASVALRKARHVFLYPSVVRSINEVYQFIKLAREANVILQCGRTGKAGINGLLNVIPDINAIGIIELRHGIKFSKSTLSNGIPNILLGDIEIVNNLVHARNISIKAKGLGMLSPQPEIINARLEFDNGCAVNYYCNMLAAQNEHFITLVLKDSILKYNFINHELTGSYLKRSINQNENPIFIENIQVERTDCLCDDLSGFFNLIRSGAAFLSIYDNGFESLVLTDRIHEKVLKTLVQYA
jgi:hypothetical protein